MATKDDSLREYEESVTTLIAFFLVSTGIGIIFFVVYLYINPWSEQNKESDTKNLSSGATYRLIQRGDVAKVLLIVAYTCIYYSISISFTMFNKWFLNYWEGKTYISFDYTYSVLNILMHFFCRWIFVPGDDDRIPHGYQVPFITHLGYAS